MMARRSRVVFGGVALLLVLFQSSHPGPVLASGHGAGLGDTGARLSFAGEALPEGTPTRVDRWMEHFLMEGRPSFERFLAREGAYSEMLRSKLETRGMPADLSYAAMIESGFLSGARSSSTSALGLWQFLGATARAQGLQMDGWVDERRDPLRATDAALDYLASLHEGLGSWVLALAAYNAGPARVHAALAEVGITAPVTDEGAYWQIEERLPRETRNHVAKVLAASLVAERADRFGLLVTPDPPLRFDVVLVPPGTSLAQVARSLGTPVQTLRALNPHLLQGSTPPGRSMPLRVPEGRGSELAELLS
jgi:membrane-bound lytic murein transglycosylase D